MTTGKFEVKPVSDLDNEIMRICLNDSIIASLFDAEVRLKALLFMSYSWQKDGKWREILRMYHRDEIDTEMLIDVIKYECEGLQNGRLQL